MRKFFLRNTFTEKIANLYEVVLSTLKNVETVSTLAASTAREAQPKLMGAVNNTAAVVDSLKDFSSHPTLSLGSFT